MNDIIKHKFYFEVILRNKLKEEVGRAFVNNKHFPKVSKYTWRMHKGYVVGTVEGKNTFLHRFILGITDPSIKVDHRDNNPLNNRDYNIRKCTQRQNLMNTSMRSSNTSGVIGVVFDKARNKWRAQIRINGKVTNLGRRDTKEEAIKLRLQAEKEYYGDFAPQVNKEDFHDKI